MQPIQGISLRVWAPGFDAPRTLVCEGVTRLVLGRSSACDVQLPLALISGKHLEVRHRHGILEIADLGSTNGTALDGTKLKPHLFMPIHSGSVVTIEEVSIEVSVLTEDSIDADAFTLQESAAFMRQLVADAINTGGGLQASGSESAYVHFVEGPNRGVKLALAGEQCVVGSMPDAWWLVRESGWGERVAQVVQNEQGDFEWHSFQEGVQIDGELLKAQSMHVLKHDMKIRVGQSVVQFHDPLALYLMELEDEPEPLSEPTESGASEEQAAQEDVQALEPASDSLPLPVAEEQEEASLATGVEEEPPAKKKKAGLSVVELMLLGGIVLVLIGCVVVMLVLFELV